MTVQQRIHPCLFCSRQLHEALASMRHSIRLNPSIQQAIFCIYDGGARPWLMMWNSDRMLLLLMAARQAVTTRLLAAPTGHTKRGQDRRDGSAQATDKSSAVEPKSLTVRTTSQCPVREYMISACTFQQRGYCAALTPFGSSGSRPSAPQAAPATGIYRTPTSSRLASKQTRPFHTLVGPGESVSGAPSSNAEMNDTPPQPAASSEAAVGNIDLKPSVPNGDTPAPSSPRGGERDAASSNDSAS